MARRFSGSLRVLIYYAGGTYNGLIQVPGKGNWLFNDLDVPHYGDAHAPEMFDRVAEHALSFGGFYSSKNRSGEVPAWAPPEELANAICSELEYPPEEAEKYPVIQGVYIGKNAVVARSPAAMNLFYDAHEAHLAKKRPRQLFVIEGGKTRNATAA